MAAGQCRRNPAPPTDRREAAWGRASELSHNGIDHLDHLDPIGICRSAMLYKSCVVQISQIYLQWTNMCVMQTSHGKHDKDRAEYLEYKGTSETSSARCLLPTMAGASCPKDYEGLNPKQQTNSPLKPFALFKGDNRPHHTSCIFRHEMLCKSCVIPGEHVRMTRAIRIPPRKRVCHTDTTQQTSVSYRSCTSSKADVYLPRKN